MRDERSLRRDDFEWGVSVRLADRQYWSFPNPEQIAARPLGADETAQYLALTRGILESDSRAEVLQAELALTIFLLGRNYDLSPAVCFQMLCFPAGDSGLLEAQQALHSLSMEHVRARRTLGEARPQTPTQRTVRRSLLGRVRAAISA